jgi:hypothetical protein
MANTNVTSELLDSLLVLLCHKVRFTMPQHGQRSSRFTISRAMRYRNVGIESGTWRCIRPAATRGIPFG